MKCMIILNPSSGKEQALQYEELLREKLQHYMLDVRQTQKEGDATTFAQFACTNRYDLVVLVGGDGTLNEGINGIAEQSHRPQVALVPLGTVNDFARALHIPLEPEEAIALIGQQLVYADIGKVNDRYFTNVVAIGAMAEALGDVSVEQKSALGSLAYLLDGAKAMLRNETFTVDVELNGEQLHEEALLVLCVLTDSIGTFSAVNEEADVADGLLHLFIIREQNALQLIGTAKNLLTGNYANDAHILKYETRAVTIVTPTNEVLHVDGDNIDGNPAHISILPRHIAFYCGALDEK